MRARGWRLAADIIFLSVLTIFTPELSDFCGQN
jgi:hypothetical protein